MGMPMFLVLGNFLQDDIQSSWLPPKEVLTKSHIATLLPDKNNLHVGCLIALGTTKGDTDKIFFLTNTTKEKGE